MIYVTRDGYKVERGVRISGLMIDNLESLWNVNASVNVNQHCIRYSYRVVSATLITNESSQFSFLFYTFTSSTLQHRTKYLRIFFKPLILLDWSGEERGQNLKKIFTSTLVISSGRQISFICLQWSSRIALKWVQGRWRWSEINKREEEDYEF